MAEWLRGHARLPRQQWPIIQGKLEAELQASSASAPTHNSSPHLLTCLPPAGMAHLSRSVLRASGPRDAILSVRGMLFH